jgi:hypothetical protein
LDGGNRSVNARSLGVVGITLIGIWLLVLSISYAATIASTVLADLEIADSHIAPFVVNAAAGILLVLWRDQIAARLFASDELSAGIGSRELQTALFSFAGVLTAASGLVALVNAEVRNIYVRQGVADELLGVFERTPDSLVVTRITEGIRLAVGVALLMGAQGLSGVLESIRRAGRPK